MIYWDTSCVLKLYVSESDSSHWERQATTLDGPFVSSAIIEAELACALVRKELQADLVPGGAQKLLEVFRQDVRAGRFQLFPVGSDVLASVHGLASLCSTHPPPIFLRTLDAIHLATATLLKCRQVATADDRMRLAAARLELDVVRGEERR